MAGTWLYVISARSGCKFALNDGPIPVTAESYRNLIENGRIREVQYWSGKHGITQKSWNLVEKGDELFICTGDKDLGIIGYAKIALRTRRPQPQATSPAGAGYRRRGNPSMRQASAQARRAVDQSATTLRRPSSAASRRRPCWQGSRPRSRSPRHAVVASAKPARAAGEVIAYPCGLLPSYDLNAVAAVPRGSAVRGWAGRCLAAT
jgi:hypothetical protein